jgi:hypothetical protein
VKVALAIRAAMLAIALLVIVAPIPYLAREEPGTASGHHEHLTYLDAIGGHGEAHERAVLAWWVACAAMLAWAELARRRHQLAGAGRAIRWVVVIAASILVFVRPLGASTEHLDRLEGAGAIDLAAVVYLLAMFAGTVAALAEPDPT